jgi:S-formylglutathione hydrolase
MALELVKTWKTFGGELRR